MDSAETPRPDGGAAYLSWNLDAAGLDTSQVAVLACLGAAVVAQWDILPHDIRKALFDAATGKQTDPTGLKQQIARFLHDRASQHGEPRQRP